ncbi:abcB1 [Symbiodinium sp. CCMP2592]|nr:abcB1 [Symbiodinium sp. CCMP2592]
MGQADMRRLSAKWMSNMPDSWEIGPDAGPQTQRLSWTQLDGERQGGIWKKLCAVADGCEAVAGSRLASEQLHCSEMYMRMHNRLLQHAAAIQAEGQQAQEDAQERTGMEAPTIASSLKLLKEEVFSLCPLHFLISGIVISFVLTMLSFLVPAVQGQLVDVAVDAARKYAQQGGPESVDIGEVLFEPIVLLSVLMFSSYFCEILVGILFAICGHTTVTRLRIKLFRNLTEQEIAFYDSHVSGELSSRLINDSQALSSLTQFTTQTVLGAVVKFAGSLIAMYATHPQLALIAGCLEAMMLMFFMRAFHEATIITPINMVLVRRTGKTVGHYGVVQNHAMAKANAVAVEVLGSIRTVQSNVGEQQEAVFFTERLNRYLRIIKATVYLETVLRFTQYGLSKIRNIVVLAVAMHQVITGSLTIGGYTAFSQYVNLYEDGFKNLADIWINFKQTVTSTGKFIQLLLRRPEIPFEGGFLPPVCRGSLVLEDVSFAYSGRADLQVLTKVRLEANPGDIVALIGESGAGKTTLGRLLLRYYDPSDGSITLDGLDYRSYNIRWLRSQIGFVEQEPVLFDRKLSDNIAYGSAKGAPREEIEAAARRANAHKFITDLQSGYETHPGERAARISGGQKQRVAIARAIIRNPKMLVLDEATSALDSENEHIVQQALDELMRGKSSCKTTFIIAHRLSTVVRSTKILVLDKGHVVEQGTHDELVSNEGSRYASFMKHQIVSPLLS